ncbi:GNAT family N-acetyltransferase [Paraburkholderia sp.]|uniref:GNAT family N-acetyltransferase n=1 Tax=Paraburkholderia sp. TaxID=1926495 RepID=UPI000F2C14D9|nr:GNAT family N-acetyltransferase [Paraburkholderia sp.]
MSIEVREANVEDAEAIATVHVATWQAAYIGIIPEQFLNDLTVTGRTAGWQKALGSGRIRVLLAHTGNMLVGWVAFGRCRDEDKDGQWAEVEAFYVLPSWWGKGVGRSLSDAAQTRLRDAGYKHVALWVLAENHRAIAAYQKLGFAHDGTSKSAQIGGASLVELRYYRALAD